VWPVSRLRSWSSRPADPFYTEALFRETAAGIPGARLVLYPGMGHPPHGRRSARDVLAFLSVSA